MSLLLVYYQLMGDNIYSLEIWLFMLALISLLLSVSLFLSTLFYLPFSLSLALYYVSPFYILLFVFVPFPSLLPLLCLGGMVVPVRTVNIMNQSIALAKVQMHKHTHMHKHIRIYMDYMLI